MGVLEPVLVFELVYQTKQHSPHLYPICHNHLLSAQSRCSKAPALAKGPFLVDNAGSREPED